MARLVRVQTDMTRFFGCMKGELIIDEDDDLFSTGAWVSDEWDPDWESPPGEV